MNCMYTVVELLYTAPRYDAKSCLTKASKICRTRRYIYVLLYFLSNLFNQQTITRKREEKCIQNKMYNNVTIKKRVRKKLLMLDGWKEAETPWNNDKNSAPDLRYITKFGRKQLLTCALVRETGGKSSLCKRIRIEHLTESNTIHRSTVHLYGTWIS